MPASVMNRVASSTRKRLRADHSMMLVSMSVLPVMMCLQFGDHIFTRAAFDQFEGDGATGLDAGGQRGIGQREIHGHGGPVQRRDRIMCDAHSAIVVDGIQ